MARSQERVVKMLKLKRKPLLRQEEVQETKKSPKKSGSKNNLPPDEYKDEFEPLEMSVDENRKFILSVKREPELGLPCADVRQYMTTEKYTGFTKKGINFPIELIPELIEELQHLYEKCEEKGLFD